MPVVPRLEHVDTVLTSWRAGRLGDALRKAEQLAESDDPAISSAAKQCVETLSGFANEQRTSIERIRGDDPVTAAGLLALLAKRYQPSSIGEELAVEAAALAKDRTVVKERKAREIYQAIHRVASPLVGKGKVNDKAFVNRYSSRQSSLLCSRLRTPASCSKNKSANSSNLTRTC